MSHLDDRLFEDMPFGVLALKAFGKVDPDFRLYSAGWLGMHPNYHGREVKGAEFRRAKAGARKGHLAFKIAGTERTTYVSAEAIRKQTEKMKKGGSV